eukprot:15479213-Alexandrium_andersonii.AAC.1
MQRADFSTQRAWPRSLRGFPSQALQDISVHDDAGCTSLMARGSPQTHPKAPSRQQFYVLHATVHVCACACCCDWLCDCSQSVS